MKKYESFTGLA